jgi:NAD(P)-dependent dehydrogenase (short-subunit alcohol dehydrogenase family)
MDLELKGKAVLVTGGSKGIGLACAAAFLAEGARVVLVSRDESNLAQARAQLGAGERVATIAADLRQPDVAQDVAARAEAAFGPTDILVNSAGAARRYLPDELDARAWHDAMDAKYFTYVHTLEAVLPRMAARGRGVVVNIIGTGGKVATSYHLPGGAANSALMLATVGLAQVYGPKGVRITAINPAATLTGRVTEALKLEAKVRGVSEREVLEQGQAKVPLRRYAAPEDIANLTLFLASDRAGYITGAIIPMDGGANPII